MENKGLAIICVLLIGISILIALAGDTSSSLMVLASALMGHILFEKSNQARRRE